MEAEPPEKPVNLGPGESRSYTISWEYNLAKSSKEELIRLTRQNVLRATWEDESGRQYEQILIASE